MFRVFTSKGSHGVKIASQIGDHSGQPGQLARHVRCTQRDPQCGFAAAQDLDKGPKDVALGNDAHQVAIAHHGEAADLLLYHKLRSLLKRTVLGHRKGRTGHHLLDLQVSQQIVRLKDGQRRSCRGRCAQQIRPRDDADQLSPLVHHRQVVNPLITHDAEGIVNRGVRCDGDWIGGHTISNQHRNLPFDKLRARGPGVPLPIVRPSQISRLHPLIRSQLVRRTF